MPAYMPNLLRDRVLAQIKVARAEALLGAARFYLHGQLAELWDGVPAGRPVSAEQRAGVTLAAVNAATNACQAVDLVCQVAGTSALYETGPLERCFHDVHAAAKHYLVTPTRYETVGRVLFGLETGGAML